MAVTAPTPVVRQHPALQAMCPSFRSDAGSTHLLVSHCIRKALAHMLMRNGLCRLLHACCHLRTAFMLQAVSNLMNILLVGAYLSQPPAN